MATASRKNALMDRISKMLPSIPIGPPLPKRELVKLLKRVNEALEQVIAALEKEGKTTAPRKRRTTARKAVKKG